MSATILVAGIAAFATLLAAVVHNFVSIRSFKLSVSTETEAQRVKERAELTAAHVAATDAMARVSEQMATTTYGFIDQLQRHLHMLIDDSTSKKLSHEKIISDLQDKLFSQREECAEIVDRLNKTIVSLRLELDNLRARIVK